MATVLLDSYDGAAGVVTGHTSDSGATYTKHPRSGASTLRLDGSGALRSQGTAPPVAVLASTVPTTAEQTGTATVKRVGASNFQGPGVLLRGHATLLKGYALRYNCVTSRWELYRLTDDGTTRASTILNTYPVVPLAVGDSTAASLHVWDLNGTTTRLQVTLIGGGGAQTPYDDTDAARQTVAGRVGIYHTGSGGSDTDGVHLESLQIEDATVGTPPTAPSSATATVTGATTATLASVDASSDETGWHDWWAPDLAGVPDEANKVDLGTWASTTTAATGATTSRTVTGLLDGTEGLWLGRAAVGAGGESTITWTSASIDTPAMPVVESIDSPLVGTTVPAGNLVVLSATLTDAESETWWRGDPNDGGEQLGPNPYTYDTTGQPDGIQTLYIQGLNSYGDEALASVDLGIGATATRTSLPGGDLMILAQNEPDSGARTVPLTLTNADGSAYTTAVADLASVVLGNTAAENALTAVDAVNGEYQVELTSGEVATLRNFRVRVPGKGPGTLVQIQAGVGVNEDGAAAATLSSTERLAVAGAIDSDSAVLAAIKARTDRMPDDPATETTVNTRLAAADYTAPDNVKIAAIKTKTDNLPSSPAAVGSAMALTPAAQAALITAGSKINFIFDGAGGASAVDSVTGNTLATGSYTIRADKSMSVVWD